MDVCYECCYCNRSNFTSKRALTQHQLRADKCRAKAQAELLGRDDKCNSAVDFMEVSKIIDKSMQKQRDALAVYSQEVPNNNGVEEASIADSFMEYDDDQFGDFHEIDEDSLPYHDHLGPPSQEMRANFKAYCQRAQQFLPLTRNHTRAIRLLDSLRKSKASLETYDAMMLWHLRESGELAHHETVGNSFDFISLKILFNFLAMRYNIDAKKHNIIKEIALPGCRARAKIVVNDAQMMIQSLLADPRIKDEDYLFFDDDPFAPPPDDLDYVSDLNTGLSYTETYKKLITNPGKQVLLPVPFYIDGAVTGQFSALEVTAVKFSLGIFTRKARDRHQMWRTLGYVPTITKHKSRGNRLLWESGHVDGVLKHGRALPGEGNVAKTGADTCQDFHAMLDVILESFVDLQDNGFVWDLYYKGQLYEGVEFIPYIPFIRSDTQEADNLCGKYLSRGRGVKQLCRYCVCPAGKSDDPGADYARKTVDMIYELVVSNDLKALKDLSQHWLLNAWYRCRFGLHNGEGIHGACPLELLHALNLGLLKYVRDCFFEQIGEYSQLADEINALCIEMGHLFARQSDRKMPKTKFSDGIRAGKLMAKEYTGVMLVIAAVLRSEKGRQLLENQGQFADPDWVADWLLLIETLLQWEQWLKSDVMLKSELEQADKKFRYVLFMIKQVAKRSKGMKLKIMKYHGFTHMVQDIRHFGVPMEVDTGSNESGHKPAKTAAKLTQKRLDTFDHQVGKRLTEVFLIELAKEEMEGRSVWNYPYGQWHPQAKEPTIADPKIGGTTFLVEFDAEQEKYSLSRATKRVTSMDDVFIEDDFLHFVAKLQERVGFYIEIQTNYKRGGHIFNGSCSHTGQVWRDWVMIEWEGYDEDLPAKIWGFVNLSQLSEDNNVQCGGLTGIPPGLYAIVESSTWDDEENVTMDSQIFRQITTEVGQIRNNRVTKLKFYLADVEAFKRPLVVIPHLGYKPNAYFVCSEMDQWRRDFAEWLLQDNPDEDLDMYHDEEGSDDESSNDN